MPLPKHTVQPVRISQVPVPVDADNELEFVSNATLCNLMRQLASISQLATNMFEELTSELSNLAERTMRLQNRLVTLRADVQSMQSGDEDLTANTPPVQLAPFSSKKPADSRVLSRHTIPPSMRACYDRADAPPPLEQMDELRDDNRVSMKLFSDPDFFFDLWSQKMLQDPRHKGPRRKGGKPKTKGLVNKNATSKPQIVIQQTGVGGNYVPGQTGLAMNNVSAPRPPTSPLVNNYVGKAVTPTNQQQQSMEHTLPPPPPPPTLPQTPISLNSGSYQSPVITNGISLDKPVHNAAYPQSVAVHTMHQINGHSNVPNYPPSQTPHYPVHVTSPMQHPPPPPLPSDVTFNNMDAHVMAPAKGYPSPPKDLNVPNSLDEARFPLPVPSFFSNEPQHIGANSPGNASLSSHDLPPPPAPIFDTPIDEDCATQSRGQPPHPSNYVSDMSSNGSVLPPPPPPPPPPPFLLFDTPTTGVDSALTNKMGNLNVGSKDSQPKERVIPLGPPQDLLSAIRAGFTLRKVTDRAALKTDGDKSSRNMSLLNLGNKPNDVQAIYEAVRRRRECMENNSTDDENTESSDWDD